MQQVTNTNVKTPVARGYHTSLDEKRENYYKTEPHIHKHDMFSNTKAIAHKLTNDIFTYFPKGFAGSKNSNFYEYLSMGLVPYIGGSAMLMALSKAANHFFDPKSNFHAENTFKNLSAGVLLYGIGKWASVKLSRTLIQKSTGVPLDASYINKVVELPEGENKEGIVRTQYPKIFDSIEFYRNDILKKDGELNHGDSNYFYNEIAKKAGYSKKLNSAEQEMGDKVRKLRARSGAMENINKYIAAACGVMLGSQKAFTDMKFTKGIHPRAIYENVKNIILTFKNAMVQLWKGEGNRNFLTKNFGKIAIIATAATIILDWLIPTLAFKTKPNTMMSKVDDKKEYEVG